MDNLAGRADETAQDALGRWNKNGVEEKAEVGSGHRELQQRQQQQGQRPHRSQQQQIGHGEKEEEKGRKV